jgi:simple sugar transport system permease protein
MKKADRIQSFFEVFRVIFAVLLAYALSLIIISLVSKEPLYAIRLFIFGPFARLSRIGDMISLAIPLMFTGLCMCFVYAVNKFNFVGEGIFIFSGCIITYVAIKLGDNVPRFIILPVLLAVGGICGAALSAFPAYLNQKFKANIVVVSLMMNYILQYFTQYVMKFQIKDTSLAITGTLPIPKAALLQRIVPGTTIHSGLLIALVCVAVVMVIFYKTPFGYSMRTVGINPDFAKYSGMKVGSIVIAAQMLGGLFAGMGGAVEILGRYTRFQWTALTGHGFDGLLVAVLAYRNPLLVPVGALLLAYIRIGADIVNRSTDLSAEFVTIIQGIIILLIAAEMFLSSFKQKMIFKAAREEEGKK